MPAITVALRSLPGTGAAVGWANGHTVTIDRPTGRAGGLGLGFNGGEMLALAIGGCFCNDLRYVANALGVGIDAIAIDVTLQLDGSPALVTDAVLDVAVAAAPGVDVAALIARARAESTISNSVARGIAVTVRATSL